MCIDTISANKNDDDDDDDDDDDETALPFVLFQDMTKELQLLSPDGD